jgi:hypothetical protein
MQAKDMLACPGYSKVDIPKGGSTFFDVNPRTGAHSMPSVGLPGEPNFANPPISG